MPAAQSFCFIHAADLHLDTQFSGFRFSSPAVRQAVLDASFAAWDSLVSVAIERKAAFLLLAGDIYDGPQRGVRAQLRFVRGLERLAGAGIRVFIVHGNHDPLGGWSAIRVWPEGVTVFGSAEVEWVSMPGVTIHGISYPRRDVTENLALRFRRGPEPGLHIALLHANVGDVTDHAPYSPCTVDQLCESGIDYWALGHVHQHAILRAGDPWIVYPGCLQGRSTHVGERGAKGAVVVHVDDGRIRSAEFAPLDAVRFVPLDLDIAAYDDLNILRGALAAAGEEIRAQHAGRGLLLRATLQGRGRIHGDLQRADAVASLLGDLRAEQDGTTPILWWDDIIDETRAELDLEAVRARGDFASELLDVADRLAADPARMTSLVAARFKPLQSARIPRDVMPEHREDLLDRAVRIALHRLDVEMPGS